MVETVIQENNEKINAYQRDLEALKRFENAVGTAKDSFDSVNRNKKSVLCNLDGIKAENKAAEIYQEGMRDSLTGVGEGVVDIAFWGLELSVQMIIKSYSIEIAMLQAENEALSAVDL